MDSYQVIATVSLGVQIAVLFLLVGGFALKRMKKYRQHGIAMLSAVVLHAMLVLGWMIPSFRGFFVDSGAVNFADAISIIVLVHAVTGIVALVLGVWLVGSWRLKADMKTCFAKKKIMRVTLPLWLISLILGIILYLAIIQLF